MRENHFRKSLTFEHLTYYTKMKKNITSIRFELHNKEKKNMLKEIDRKLKLTKKKHLIRRWNEQRQKQNIVKKMLAKLRSAAKKKNIWYFTCGFSHSYETF